MILTFVLSDSQGRLHLVEHSTKYPGRPSFIHTDEVNVEQEWERCKDVRPEMLERIMENAMNTYDEPSLVGALHVIPSLTHSIGSITWYEGVERESWQAGTGT